MFLSRGRLVVVVSETKHLKARSDFFLKSHNISSITHLYELVHAVGLNDGQLCHSSYQPLLILADSL